MIANDEAYEIVEVEREAKNRGNLEIPVSWAACSKNPSTGKDGALHPRRFGSIVATRAQPPPTHANGPRRRRQSPELDRATTGALRLSWLSRVQEKKNRNLKIIDLAGLSWLQLAVSWASFTR